jgi:hypothetical protein
LLIHDITYTVYLYHKMPFVLFLIVANLLALPNPEIHLTIANS